MKILADLHHGDLFYSLQLLFEKRLGWELYKPIGLEWYTEGYWKVFPHINTAHQYLGINQHLHTPKDIRDVPLPMINRLNIDYKEKDGIYYVNDHTKNECNKGITLEKFKNTKFDILISSMPAHIEPFNKLIQLYQPQAKHIFQVGNAWGRQEGVNNILASTAPFPVSENINTCFYHQEFDLNYFNYREPNNSKQINSYIHYMDHIDIMETVAKQMPEWKFTTYGAGMENAIDKTKDIAKEMQTSSFTWHTKKVGDGFGHIIHNTYACGRPAIIIEKYYRNKLANQLLKDNDTAIFIDGLSPQAIAEKILYWSQPERHKAMCVAAYNQFKQVVDYDTDEIRIRKFIENLI